MKDIEMCLIISLFILYDLIIDSKSLCVLMAEQGNVEQLMKQSF